MSHMLEYIYARKKAIILLIPGKQKFEARILTSIVAPKSFSKLFSDVWATNERSLTYPSSSKSKNYCIEAITLHP